MEATKGEQPSSMKKRILFVDDEPALLASLENLLRRDRGRWEMVFAVGGQRALDELRRGSFDVVVSDMRMPDVDGATLMCSVQSESPSTVRIMLTGYASDDEVRRALPALHELVNKPCSVAVLRGIIERSLAGELAETERSPEARTPLKVSEAPE